jgi:hypothetical protein
VYATIVDLLVAAAAEHGEVLYAVPGSPLVLERTVRRLRADERIECVVHAGDVVPRRRLRSGSASTRSRAGLTSWSTATSSPPPRPGYDGPLLVAHTHANWVLSDIKLAAENATGDEPVVILQRLGTPTSGHAHHVGRARSHRRCRPPHVHLHPRPRRTRSAPSWSASTSSPAPCASSARGTRSRRTSRS